jgi:hypothetical protein
MKKEIKIRVEFLLTDRKRKILVSMITNMNRVKKNIEISYVFIRT